MLRNDTARRLLAVVLVGLLIDTWTLEPALTAGSLAPRPSGADELLVPPSKSGGNPSRAPSDERLAQNAPHKRKPVARPPRPPLDPAAALEPSHPDPAALDRYSRTLDEIAALVAAEQARGAVGGSSEMRAVGPDVRMSVRATWDETKARVVASALSKARQAIGSEAHVERSFAAYDAHIHRNRLPAVIRDRQREAQGAFRASRERFHRALTALERAQARKDPAAAHAALEDLARLAAKPQAPGSKSLPWGASRARQAAVDSLDLEIRGARIAPPQLAAAGSLSGIQLPDGNPLDPPGPDDIAPTQDAPSTTQIRQLAQDLGNSPVRIYDWVRNNVEYAPGFGATQNAAQVLLSRRGNAFDIASLLIALYRAAAIPARYVYGTIEVPSDRLQGWLGLDAEAARKLLTQAGVPNTAVVAGGKTSALRLEHMWVSAWIDYIPSRGAVNRQGDTWVPLDAAFKQHSLTPGLDIGAGAGLNPFGVLDAARAGASCTADSSANVNALALDSARSSFSQRASDLVASLGGDASVGAVLGTTDVAAENYSILLGTLPYATVVEGATFSAMPDALRWKLHWNLYAGEADRGHDSPTAAFSSSLPAVSGQRITLSFAPASDADARVLASFLPAARSDGGPIDPSAFPASIPGYLVRVKAELRQEGSLIASGGSFVLGAPLLLSGGLFDPAQGVYVDADSLIAAGEYHALAVDALGTTADQATTLSVRAAALSQKLVGNGAALTRDEVTGELLWQAVSDYFAAADEGAKLFSRASDSAEARLPSFGRASSELASSTALGVIVGVSSAAMTLNIDRLAAAGTTRTSAGSAALEQSRLDLAAAYAPATLDRLFVAADRPGQAAGALRVLAEANREHVQVLHVDASGFGRLDAIDIDPAAKQDLAGALAAGQQIVVPERPVSLDGEAVSGFVVTDAQTGSGTWTVVAASGRRSTARLNQPFGLQWLALISPSQITASVSAAAQSAQSLSTSLAAALGEASASRFALYPARTVVTGSAFLAQLAESADAGACARVTLAMSADALAGTLGSSVTNHAPVVSSTAVTTATDGGFYRYLLTASDPDGDPLRFSISRGPGGLQIDATGLITWDHPVAGTYPVVALADDGKLYTVQSYVLNVTAGPTPLDLSLSVSPSVVDPAQSVVVTVASGGGAGRPTTALTVDGQSVALDAEGQARITAAASGVHRIVAEATDAGGTVRREAVYSVRDAADTSTPNATLTAPLADSEITSAVDVVASVGAAQLAFWQLLYRSAGSGDWRELNRGFSPVLNGVVGRLDPSVLANDIYEVSLVAFDVNGRRAESTVTVEVTRRLKVGQFTLSFEDLNIEASGIPVLLTRTYDTLRRNQALDFGFGWSADYQNVVIRKNMTLGLSWTVAKPALGSLELCLRPEGTRKINIQLPGSDIARFEARNDPECAFGQAPPVQITFNPLPGTNATLEAIGVPGLIAQGGQIVDTNDFSPWNPTQFKLTTREGFVFYITEGVGIVQAKDLSGNTLTYTHNGLVHSSGQSILFTRDAQGRITAVTDPAGKQLVYAYDDNGDLVSVTDRLGQVSRMNYDARHGLISYTDARGVELIKYVYDEQGRMIAVLDADGQRIQAQHLTDSSQETVTDRRGNSTSYVYDGDGNVTQTTDALGNVTASTYDAQGNELTSTDALGNVTTRSFDTNARLVLSETDPLGHTLSWAYNQSGQPGTTTDAKGNVTHYVHFGNGGQTINEPLGRSSSLLLDSGGNLATLAVAGQVTRYSYDAKGNRIAETDAAGNVTSYSFDANGNETGRSWQRTLDTGVKVTLNTQRSVDAQGRVVSETDALGFKTQTRYDAAGNVIAQTDAAGRTTTFDYDVKGRLVRTTYPDAGVETIDYDAEGNQVATTDRQGRVTRFEYDALNRLTRTIHPDGSAEAQTYDPAGRMIAVTDPVGNVAHNEYDAAGRLTSTTDALGHITRFDYDENGNRTKVADALGNLTQFQYDELNRLTRTTWPDGKVSLVTWRLDGRKESDTDPNGNTTRYGYDALGRLTQVTQTVAGVDYLTAYAYDEVGNKISQTDARGRVTKWGYDHAGRVIKRVLPLGQTETFAYDANGNLSAHTDFNAQTTRFAYDAGDRLTLKLYPDGSKVSFSYTPAGQVQGITDARGTTQYSYDASDRLSRVVQPDGTFIAYAYDARGNRTELSTPSGTARYEYDANNRLTCVTDAEGQQTRYAYDAVGNKLQVSYPNGTQVQYRYDALNRILEVAHSRLDATGQKTLLLGLAYTLSKSGQRSRIDEYEAPSTFDAQAGFSGTAVRVSAYAYDEIGRLTREQLTDAPNPTAGYSADYVYDQVGNRLSKTLSPAVGLSTVTTYSYDANDRLTQEQSSSGASTTITAYGYDANGNTRTKTSGSGANAVTVYDYDAENRLISVRSGDSPSTAQLIASYACDGNGNRVTKSETTPQGLKTTSFLVDENQQYAQVLEEREAVDGHAPQLTVAYLYGDDLLNQVRGGQRSYYHHDGLGSTRALSDGAGTVMDSYRYEAFGNAVAFSGKTANVYRFAGEQFDSTTGFLYFRARYYDTGTGRFSVPDRWDGISARPASLHKYLYAAADPANNRDPSGYFALSDTAAAAQISGIINTVAMAAVLGPQLKEQLGLVVKPNSAKIGAALIARECARNRRKDCDAQIPIIFYGYDVNEFTEHVAEAMWAPKFVTPILNRAPSSHDRGWIYSTEECKGKTGRGTGLDCDEFPFAASEEGGVKNYPRVSLKPLNAGHNQAAGRYLWNKLLRPCDIKRSPNIGSTFVVVPAIGLANTYGRCANGQINP